MKRPPGFIGVSQRQLTPGGLFFSSILIQLGLARRQVSFQNLSGANQRVTSPANEAMLMPW
jgi:hypothetical protein